MFKILRLLLLVISPSAGADIVVRDFLDRDVVLQQPAQRIVALAPHIVENLYSAGAGDKIVAAAEWSNYPEAAKALPRVGNSGRFSVEAIIAMRPDLVVAWATSNIGLAATLEQLKALGIAVYIDEPHTLSDVSRVIRDMGALAGTEHTANQVAREFDANVRTLRQRYKDQTSVSVLYQVWNNPLQTINGDHIISAVIELCGGHNSFADAVTLAPRIGIEAVIERDPQAIVASGPDGKRPHWLDDWKDWPSLSAVQNNHLFFVPPDYLQRHTVRILKGAELMCGHLQQVRLQLSNTEALNSAQRLTPRP